MDAEDSLFVTAELHSSIFVLCVFSRSCLSVRTRSFDCNTRASVLYGKGMLVVKSKKRQKHQRFISHAVEPDKLSECCSLMSSRSLGKQKRGDQLILTVAENIFKTKLKHHIQSSSIDKPYVIFERISRSTAAEGAWLLSRERHKWLLATAIGLSVVQPTVHFLLWQLHKQHKRKMIKELI